MVLMVNLSLEMGMSLLRTSMIQVKLFTIKLCSFKVAMDLILLWSQRTTVYFFYETGRWEFNPFTVQSGILISIASLLSQIDRKNDG
jgi:hypothetical protein